MSDFNEEVARQQRDDALQRERLRARPELTLEDLTAARLDALVAPPELPEDCGHLGGYRKGVCSECRADIATSVALERAAAVPALVAEVQRLREALRALVAAVDECHPEAPTGSAAMDVVEALVAGWGES